MDAESLAALQLDLAAATPPPWVLPAGPVAIGACFVCFVRGGTGVGDRGDPGWAGAAVVRDGQVLARASLQAAAGAPYQAGLLALRELSLLEAAVAALPARPDVLLVNATGRDHPRGAGLALHLGWRLDLPTIGVTHRPLFAEGSEPGPARGDRTLLTLDGRVVGAWVRTRAGARPLAVHPAWRTDLDAAVRTVLRACAGARAPEALRLARHLARQARSEGLR